jgi:hypothetical protein
MARRRKKRRAPNLYLILGIAVLIAGFVARRALMPRALHYLAYRPADSPAPAHAPDAVAPSAAPSAAPAQPQASAADSRPARHSPAAEENLRPDDRRALDDVLRKKMK